MDDATERAVYLRRLASWEDERKTNSFGMAEYADRAIKLMQDEITRKWPLVTDTK